MTSSNSRNSDHPLAIMQKRIWPPATPLAKDRLRSTNLLARCVHLSRARQPSENGPRGESCVFWLQVLVVR
jgi:hypothetical protein